MKWELSPCSLGRVRPNAWGAGRVRTLLLLLLLLLLVVDLSGGIIYSVEELACIGGGGAEGEEDGLVAVEGGRETESDPLEGTYIILFERGLFVQFG